MVRAPQEMVAGNGPCSGATAGVSTTGQRQCAQDAGTRPKVRESGPAIGLWGGSTRTRNERRTTNAKTARIQADTTHGPRPWNTPTPQACEGNQARPGQTITTESRLPSDKDTMTLPRPWQSLPPTCEKDHPALQRENPKGRQPTAFVLAFLSWPAGSDKYVRHAVNTTERTKRNLPGRLLRGPEGSSSLYAQHEARRRAALARRGLPRMPTSWGHARR